ncbi:hypothetical protein CORC01_09237 [Colletotrichum orchidophilum]|uniref:C2H2-type domain-containing protein n=1 Tax=Colletotrichum orchidophilum TaxID=1209926 RepID=A0A1G4B283_9PEZI|nr:uncharacterized protein CORC01_09237 [Colletotrichum orchidophilum]OHE95504.1 hypothetical protein CORC01_09237 [Colletotrichum orchidophilum]
MATVEESPLMAAANCEFFQCVTLGCTSKPFPTKANLSRHMTKPRRSKRLSQVQNVRQVTTATTANRIPAQNEQSGCVTPNDLYHQATDNGTRDTSYDNNISTPFLDPMLDTIYAYPGEFPGDDLDDFTSDGPITWDEVSVGPIANRRWYRSANR